MRRNSIVLALVLALISTTTNLDAKDKNGSRTEKSKVDHSKATKDKSDSKDWKRKTEGHRPQDLNGDGVITRNEWPGNDASFKELDRDGDGVLTNRDRGAGAQGGDARMYDRPVNDYPKRSKQ